MWLRHLQGSTATSSWTSFSQPIQPISCIAHSSLIPAGETVLDTTHVYALGEALDASHTRSSPAHGPAAGNDGWYARAIEFKFDDEAAPGEEPMLHIKQARPYPGREDR